MAGSQAKVLCGHGGLPLSPRFQIQLWTELGTFETDKLPVGKMPLQACGESLHLDYFLTCAAELVMHR